MESRDREERKGRWEKMTESKSDPYSTATKMTFTDVMADLRFIQKTHQNREDIFKLPIN